MRVIFMGTPVFAVPTLDKLRTSHEIISVVTKADKPKGRSLKVSTSAIKDYALQYSIPIHQPESLNDPDFRTMIEGLDAEVVVVVAYGKILPKWLLDLPPYGCINLHGSLLPKYRGAAPIQRAIMDGNMTTGVTSMFIDEGMDTGDVLLTSELTIESDDDSGTLSKKLADLGADLIEKTLVGLGNKTITPIPQDDKLATIASKIEKNEMSIDWSKSASAIRDLIRALSPRPGAFTLIEGKRVKLFEVIIVECDGSPGEIKEIDEGLTVMTGKGGLKLTEVQPEGKRQMSGDEFIRGHHLKVGEIIG